MKKRAFGIVVIIVTVALISCKDLKKKDENESNAFKLYTSKDTFLINQQVTRQIPTIDRIVRIEKSRSIIEKLQTIADSLSIYYFNDLRIAVTIDQSISNEDSTYVTVNLLEKDNYDGPGSLPSYQSWYDFFQGSAGGINTQITLEESLLQREFNGSWINGLRFLYQGRPIDEWDHVNLSGLKTR